MDCFLRIGGGFTFCMISLACHGQAVSGGTATPVQPAPQPAPSGAVLAQSESDDVSGAAANSRIRLDVRVTDRSGSLISGLVPTDFTVLDNGQPVKIATFHAYSRSDQPPDPPVQVIAVFDTVNTDFSAVSYAREQVESFLRRNGGHLTEPVTIVWLTANGFEGQIASSLDGNALAAQIDATEGRLRPANRAQGAWGAIERFQFCLQKLNEMVQTLAGSPGRKLLIWAGPGWPTPEGPSISISSDGAAHLFSEIVHLSEALRDGHVTVYSISGGLPGPLTFFYQGYLKGIKKASQSEMPDLSLKVLAVQSGGLAMPPSNDVASSLDTCYRDADAFYSLSFDPSPTDSPDQFHKVEVRVDKPGLVARTRTGYYDEPAGH